MRNFEKGIQVSEAEGRVDGRDFCTAPEQRIGTSGSNAASSDQQHRLSGQVDHHRKIWESRGKFIISAIMYTSIFSQGVHNFEKGIQICDCAYDSDGVCGKL